MRQVHRAGEKAFIDYSGKKPRIWSMPQTGEVIEVELFVMVLGASNYTYAEATRTQKLADFVGSTVRALEFFGGVPEIARARSASQRGQRSRSLRPGHQRRRYAELAQALRRGGRSRRGRASRATRRRSRRRAASRSAGSWRACATGRFFSLEELNAAIAELLEELNAPPVPEARGLPALGVRGDRPAGAEAAAADALRAGASGRRRKRATSTTTSTYDDRLYSVPYALVGERVEVRATTLPSSRSSTAAGASRSHARSYGPEGHGGDRASSTGPSSHRDYGAWPPVAHRRRGRARSDPRRAALVEQILASYPRAGDGLPPVHGAHPHARRRTDRARFDAACRRALAIGSHDHAQERRGDPQAAARRARRSSTRPTRSSIRLVHHENVRGGDYYDTKGDRPT